MRLSALAPFDPGQPLAIILLAAELAVRLSGQVLLQAQDAQGRSQAVALVEQLSDAAGEGQLAAGIAARSIRR